MYRKVLSLFKRRKPLSGVFLLVLLMEKGLFDERTMMENLKLTIRIVIGIILVGCVFSGCQRSARTPEQERVTEKVFYPAPPDIPRLQFLTSISSSADLGGIAESKGGFESFILGKDEVRTDRIVKPYGVGIHDGKLYVCDVGKKLVEELDIGEKTFGYMSKERRMINPVNISFDDKGRKYITDPTGGKVFVFGKGNNLLNVLGTDLKLKPIDVAVAGKRCYVTDMNKSEVVVLDRVSGKEIMRFGGSGDQDGKFALIGDIALDDKENVYVTDKGLAKITKFDRNGIFQMTIGKVGDSVHDFIRPKGIDIDREGRIWVIDTGPEVAKVYNPEGKLLMFFGFPGGAPGNMNMPASIAIDYDNVDLFKEYFAEGAEIEFLVLVSNQYGAKINVYGFGKFPLQEKAIEEARKLELEEESEEDATKDGEEEKPSTDE